MNAASARKAKEKGWKVGTHLVGYINDELTQLEIVYLSDQTVLTTNGVEYTRSLLDERWVSRMDKSLIVDEAAEYDFGEADTVTVTNVPEVLKKVEELELQVESIRALHVPKTVTVRVPVFDEFDSPVQVQTHCAQCGAFYPCKTIKILGVKP